MTDSDYSELMIKPPPPQASEERLHERVLSFCRKSHFYSLVSKRSNVLVERYTRDEEAEYERSRHTPPELYLCRREPTITTTLLYRTMGVLLRTIAQYVGEREVPVIFVAAPSFIQVDRDLWSSALEEFGEEAKDYDPSSPNTRLMRYAQNNNLLMIDLLPILRSEVNKGNEVYDPKQQHWNSEGNRVVADALLYYLKMAALVDTLSN